MGTFLFYSAFSSLADLYTEETFHNINLQRLQKIYILEGLICLIQFYSQHLQMYSPLFLSPSLPKQYVYFMIYLSWVKTTYLQLKT